MLASRLRPITNATASSSFSSNLSFRFSFSFNSSSIHTYTQLNGNTIRAYTKNLCSPLLVGCSKQSAASPSCECSTSTNTSTNTNTKRHYSNSAPRSQEQSQKTALIIGSSGSLGSAIASQLKHHHNCVVIGSDIHPPSEERAQCIDAYIQLLDNDNESDDDNDNGNGNGNNEVTIDNLVNALRNGISDLYSDVGGNVKFDAIICASGGFAMDVDETGNGDDGDDDDDDDDDKATVGNVYEAMLQMNYYPVVAAGEIVKSHITSSKDNGGGRNGNGGLFVITGAAAALSPSPGMIAYATSKAAAHYYIQSMGIITGNAIKKEHKFQRNDPTIIKLRKSNVCYDTLTAVGVCPVMLNTKTNREALPGEDYTSWTEPVDIAREIGSWVETPAIRPYSGSLVKVITENCETEFKLAR